MGHEDRYRSQLHNETRHSSLPFFLKPPPHLEDVLRWHRVSQVSLTWDNEGNDWYSLSVTIMIFKISSWEDRQHLLGIDRSLTKLTCFQWWPQNPRRREETVQPRAVFSYNWHKKERSTSVQSDEWTGGLHLHGLFTEHELPRNHTLCPISPLPLAFGRQSDYRRSERGGQCNTQPGHQVGSSLPIAWRERTKGWGSGECPPSLQTSGKKPQTNVEARPFLSQGPPRNVFSLGCFLLSTFLLRTQRWCVPSLGFL